MWIDIIRRLDLDFLHEADEWQQNDNTISKKSTQQVEIRQNSLVSAVKTNKKHHITTLQRGVWVIFKSSQKPIKWAFASLFFAFWYYNGTKVSCAWIGNCWLGMLAFHRQQISIHIGRTPSIEMQQSVIEMVHSGWHYVLSMRPCDFPLKVFVWRNLSII